MPEIDLDICTFLHPSGKRDPLGICGWSNISYYIRKCHWGKSVLKRLLLTCFVIFAPWSRNFSWFTFWTSESFEYDSRLSLFKNWIEKHRLRSSLFHGIRKWEQRFHEQNYHVPFSSNTTFVDLLVFTFKRSIRWNPWARISRVFMQFGNVSWLTEGGHLPWKAFYRKWRS